MKTFITTEVFNEADQKLVIFPTPEFDAIQFYIVESDGTHKSGEFFITKDELPLIIERLQDMMNHVTKS